MALAWWVATGSAIDRGTDGRAARCTTASAPCMAVSSVSGSRIVPSTSSASTPRRFSGAGREVVERHDVVTGAARRAAQFAADEPCSAGHHHPHGCAGYRRPVDRLFLSPPDVGEAEPALLLDAFDSNWIAPLGPHVDGFEREFAEMLGVAGAAALSSGTAALHLALVLLGVGPGDEVLVPTLTFVAAANVVRYLGARPVFVDSDAATWNLDPVLVEAELDERAASGTLPAALIGVDLYGQSASWAPIAESCARHGVPIVDDAAEALGASYRDRPAGTFGAMGAFSFNGNKIITTSGGGMLVSDDPALIERARYLATQARDPRRTTNTRSPASTTG